MATKNVDVEYLAKAHGHHARAQRAASEALGRRGYPQTRAARTARRGTADTLYLDLVDASGGPDDGRTWAYAAVRFDGPLGDQDSRPEDVRLSLTV